MRASIDRRQFLTRAALGAAAIAASGGAALAAPRQSGMFISLAPWATARGVGWPEQARLAAEVGYKGIDWAWGPVRQAGAEATRALLAELAIVPTIVNMPGPNVLAGNVDDATFEESLKQLDEDTAFAASIGCRRFQRTLGATTSGGRSKDEQWKFVTGRLSAVNDVVAKHDVRISLEFLGPLQFRMGGGGGRGRGRRGGGPGAANANPAAPPAPPPAPPVPFVWSLAETRRLCEASGSHIGITLDAWHWYHSEGTIADILATPVDRIVHVHVSDAREMPPAEVRDDMRLLPGEGVIDLIGFFQALRKIGYQGGVAPETIGPRLEGVAPGDQARMGLYTTRAVMMKAGVA